MTQQKPTTIRQLLAVATGWLTEQGVEEAQLDTQILLAHTLACKRLDLFLYHDKPLSPDELTRFRVLMRRRGAREPVAYIVGKRGFHNLTLTVTPAVLVPRPETEHLVEAALAEIDRTTTDRLVDEGRATSFADVGTGSGCIALALASERAGLRGVALDLSSDALAVARANAKALDLADRVSFVRGNLLGAVADESLDLVVSNPPYVTPDEECLLAPEVKDHEPHLALFDADGLPLSETLVRQARRVLRSGGALAVETGFKSADRIAAFMEAEGFTEIRRVEDYGRIERVVLARKP